mgnify:CR=1 FL=1
MTTMIMPLGGVLLALQLAVPGPAWAAEGDENTPDYSRTGADTCLSCHGGDDSEHLLAIFDGPHAVAADARTPFGSTQCEACHGPGGDHAKRLRFGQTRPPIPAFGPQALWSKRRQDQLCLDCHRGAERRFWEGGAHQRHEVGCADCHRLHVRRDPVTVTETQPEVCTTCHSKQRAEIHRAYTHPVRFGEMTCADCHEPHGSANEAMLAALTVNDNCFQCHAEKRGPFLWEHAPVTEDCTLCHRTHGSNHPALLTRRAPLLCQQCHSRAGHPSIGRTAEQLPSGDPSVFLLSGSCLSCHSQVHGSNHPSGAMLNR